MYTLFVTNTYTVLHTLGVCRIRGYWCGFCRIKSAQDLSSKSHLLYDIAF